MFNGLLTTNFEPFKSNWGVWCQPQECEQGYFVPIGWEEELDLRNIQYEYRENLTIKEIEF